jgi:pimeloyl-ACP methyl ester carboxylesterase
VPELPPGAREDYADLAEVRLHYVEAGDGPLVVLLHGFPEFWFAWRLAIPKLAAAGFRVVAPDLRGYNLSSRPRGVRAYDADRLAADVRDLVRERGAEAALLAGHDWGGAVAWATASNHPEVVERLAILNAPHPWRSLRVLRRPHNLAKSWYMLFYALPWIPERLVSLRGWRALRTVLERDARPGAFGPSEITHYVSAWSRPGAATAMINYYRAAMRQSARHAESRIRPVTARTLIVWGERDRHLPIELAEPHPADAPNLEHVVRLPHASHWVQHDEPELVAKLLARFFGGSPLPYSPAG